MGEIRDYTGNGETEGNGEDCPEVKSRESCHGSRFLAQHLSQGSRGMFISVKERGILSQNGLERSKSNAADLRN